MSTKEVAKNLKKGCIFIYPGNESYEAVCDVYAGESVEKLLSSGLDGNISIIAPNKAWIYKNLYANKRYVERLPGPFTFIFKAKKNCKLPKYALIGNTVAVRIVDNELTKIAAKNNILLCSYIIRKDGKLVINANSIPKHIKKIADFIMDNGPLDIKPHIVIDLTGKIAKIVK